VLDEVDAALDATNVVRVANYMRAATREGAEGSFQVRLVWDWQAGRRGWGEGERVRVWAACGAGTHPASCHHAIHLAHPRLLMRTHPFPVHPPCPHPLASLLSHPF
jgi:hypothetical protein